MLPSLSSIGGGGGEAGKFFFSVIDTRKPDERVECDADEDKVWWDEMII